VAWSSSCCPEMAGFREHLADEDENIHEEEGSRRREREEEEEEACGGGSRGRSLHRRIVLMWVLLLQLPIAAGNDIYVVGYNDYGQLGLGDYLQRSTQTRMIRE
jgi:hypothetical protein